jgi:hypothetical protein
MSTVLVLEADAELVGEALAQAGPADDVVVIDPSPASLERLERMTPDPRLWYQLGDAEVVPLPDRFVSTVLGGGSADVERVLR